MNLTKYLLYSYALSFSITLACTAAPTFANPSNHIPAGVFGYQERVGSKIIPFNWKAETNEQGILISVYEDKKRFYNLCTPDGKTLHWSIYEEGKHDITAERKGNSLHISGKRAGEEYDKVITIDERPWYQPLSFSLRPFLDSEKEKTSFWVIRADTIEVIALTAKKKGEEIVTIEGQEVDAQRVEIRAEGFFSQFWSAQYWYRKEDNLFIRYQSVHGLPGTDETIVELVKSPTEHFDG